MRFRLILPLAVLLVLIVPPFGARAFETAARAAIIIDYRTGAVLFERNADERMPPASMSKLMTAYMVFDRLKSGRLKLDEEVLVSERFAQVNALQPADTLSAIINGRYRTLRIAGVALSPEFVYEVEPTAGFLTDERLFGVLWMGRETLAAATDMTGAFNDVSLALAPDASADEVIAELDRLLEPYGGLGAIPRAQQISHWFINNELSQLQSVGLFLPIVFLIVAAFLLNVVLTRIVSVQREQIEDWIDEDRNGERFHRYIETLPGGVQHIIIEESDDNARPDSDNTEVYTVPPDHYFGMGDNRDNSADSRVWGAIPAENLVGRASFIFYSTAAGNLWPIWDAVPETRLDRLMTGIH